MQLLDRIQTHEQLLALEEDKLPQLCEEIRRFLVDSVAKTGGHLASNLGVVELTVAIERVFDTAKDRLLFDVGHQSYVHKLLTGRRSAFSTLRCLGGMAGFPKPTESACDAFVAGHASSSVSTALGMARARTMLKQDYHVIAMIGDGALTGGLAYEGLNDAGESNEPLIVILNDNGMSINPNVGGLSKYLSFLRTRPGYFRVKKAYRSVTHSLPGGKAFYDFTSRVKDRYKGVVLGTTFFEEMGFEYYGPVDGHDIRKLEYMLRLVKGCKKPVLLHVITQKGKGYKPAEDSPAVFHGIGVFDPENGHTKGNKGHSFSDTFGRTLCEIAEKEPRVCAITAAMIHGTGLAGFAKKFPDRCYDVGIAEGHAVSMAGGYAMQGGIPVVAIYSTFLQRAYDMILQDVAMQNLHVVFAVDRAGLVGNDGETHQGIFDISFLRSVPNMQILCPANQSELRAMLYQAVFDMDGPVVVRYPRGCDGAYQEIAEDAVLRTGKDITLISYGILINEVIAAAELLSTLGISAEVIKLNSVKPINMDIVMPSVTKTKHLLVAEETVRNGCVGREISALLRARGILIPTITCNVGDAFIEHGSVAELYQLCGIDAAGLAKAAQEVLSQ
ncbi:MAG: 1-deoxy-D-xylulose-5-phosphate synthase [Oscillospiraceae bacterium]|nr:1-deoxy-D-xylulose-5-phosphate synthase [Oscillospiraceae bacterium]